ncbi:hypothetical protein HYU14_03235 [Candidatus Woesearchaeota archaeon]|nr:hypothetical protein [Candidatus Woesearchaeota archaeon]
MEHIQLRLERIRAKQEDIRELKEKIAVQQESIEDFKLYISTLPHDQDCRHMAAIGGVFNLCTNHLPCRFQGERFLAGGKEEKPECLRAKMLKFEDVLRH